MAELDRKNLLHKTSGGRKVIAAKRAGFAAAILVGDAGTVGQHAHLADYWIKDLGGLLRPSEESLVSP